MSTKAEAIIEQVRDLPPDDFREVAAQIMDLQARRLSWEEQQSRLRKMQSRHAGRGLLNRLLEERTKERRRD